MARQNQARVPVPDATSGVEAIVEAWARAWNAHDMGAAAALVANDVDFVTVAGLWLQGREEFRRHHDDIHRRHLRRTVWRTRASAVRPLRGGLSLAHLEWTITGELGRDGTPRSPRSGVFTWLLRRSRGAWLIVAAHNTNLRSDTSHRLSGRGQS